MSERPSSPDVVAPVASRRPTARVHSARGRSTKVRIRNFRLHARFARVALALCTPGRPLPLPRRCHHGELTLSVSPARITVQQGASRTITVHATDPSPGSARTGHSCISAPTSRALPGLRPRVIGTPRTRSHLPAEYCPDPARHPSGAAAGRIRWGSCTHALGAGPPGVWAACAFETIVVGRCFDTAVDAGERADALYSMASGLRLPHAIAWHGIEGARRRCPESQKPMQPHRSSCPRRPEGPGMPPASVTISPADHWPPVPARKLSSVSIGVLPTRKVPLR